MVIFSSMPCEKEFVWFFFLGWKLAVQAKSLSNTIGIKNVGFMAKMSLDCGGQRVAVRRSLKVNRFVNGADYVDRVGEFGLKGV